MNILLDMDGVICDWIGAACRAFKADPEDVIKVQPSGTFGIEIALGITRDELWKHLDSIGEKFWAEDIKPYPWASQLYAACLKLGPVYILTSPSTHVVSCAGKIKWLRNFTGNDKFRDYVLTTHKHLLAKPENILIDDDDEKVSSFREAGGNAILFPQQWNSRFEDYHRLGNTRYMDVLSTLRDCVKPAGGQG
jgi:5'(3')-deoxyribonucleotidase